MRKPFFSIVMSVYNKAKFISGTIQSVLDQSYKDFEIILVNDGSNDSSLEIINGFEDSRLRVVDQPNLGAAAARNTGIKQSEGKFVALLDGDDLWKTQYLAEMHRAILDNPEIDVFSCAIAHLIKQKAIPVPYNPKLRLDAIVDYFEGSSKHSILTSSSIVFNSNILSTIGYFNEDLETGEDTDLWIRIGIKYKIYFLSEQLVYYVGNSSSLSNNSFDISKKPLFNNYKKQEARNKYLRRFLNRNRYSMALMSKIHKDKCNFEYYYSEISLSELTIKEKIFLITPRPILNILLTILSARGKKPYYKPLK